MNFFSFFNNEPQVTTLLDAQYGDWIVTDKGPTGIITTYQVLDTLHGETAIGYEPYANEENMYGLTSFSSREEVEIKAILPNDQKVKGPYSSRKEAIKAESLNRFGSNILLPSLDLDNTR